MCASPLSLCLVRLVVYTCMGNVLFRIWYSYESARSRREIYPEIRLVYTAIVMCDAATCMVSCEEPCWAVWCERRWQVGSSRALGDPGCVTHPDRRECRETFPNKHDESCQLTLLSCRESMCERQSISCQCSCMCILATADTSEHRKSEHGLQCPPSPIPSGAR